MQDSGCLLLPFVVPKEQVKQSVCMYVLCGGGWLLQRKEEKIVERIEFPRGC